MTKLRSDHAASDDLRGRAENFATSNPDDTGDGASREDAAAVMHELRVHQIELELQNEELCHTQAELEISRRLYLDLYELAPVGYLSLDGDGRIIEGNLTLVSMLGVTRTSLSKKPLSGYIIAEDADLFHKFQRRRMAEGDAEAYSCDLRIKKHEGGFFWAHLEATRGLDTSGEPVLRVVISDVSQRIGAEADTVREAEALRLSQEQLQAALEQRERDIVTIARTLSSVIDVVVQVVESRDPYTAGHQRRVAELATAIAVDMGKSQSEVDQIRVAAMIHDVGKITIPAEILSKPGSLSPIEFELVKLHSEAGFRIVESAHLDGQIAQIIYQHHERCDGSGYPRGLRGTDLLPESRVLMVADVVEAMVSHRPYRAGLGTDAALKEIRKGAGRLFDADVVDSCARVFKNHDFKFSEVEAR